MAAPSTVHSVMRGRTRGTPRMSALIWSHASDFAPPPVATSSEVSMPMPASAWMLSTK